MTWRRILLMCTLVGATSALALAAPPAPAAPHGPSVAQGSDKPARASKSRSRKPKRGEAPAAVAPAEAAPAPAPEPGLRRSNRMELDARLIQGSTPEAGAVYLFQRAPRSLPALVHLRQSYLAEIVVPVLGPGHLAPPPTEASAP